MSVTGGIFNQILNQFTASENAAFTQIIAYLRGLDPKSAIASDVAEQVYAILRADYNITLSSQEFKDTVLSQTEGAYKALAKADPALPRTSFNLADERAMTFLENSGHVYLGDFVASDELRQRIVDYIRSAYLENGRAIGNSPKELNAFMRVFGDELGASKAQVRTIIDTTVSRARVFGQVNGLRTAAARTYEIAGPNDNLTCSVCVNMVGRQFNVASAVTQLESVLQSGPEAISATAPFLKGSIDVTDIQGMSDAELEAQGFMVPPYHPHCRHRLIVNSFYEAADEVPFPIE